MAPSMSAADFLKMMGMAIDKKKKKTAGEAPQKPGPKVLVNTSMLEACRAQIEAAGLTPSL